MTPIRITACDGADHDATHRRSDRPCKDRRQSEQRIHENAPRFARKGVRLHYSIPPRLALQGGGIIPNLVGDVAFTLDQLAALNLADPHGILTGKLDLQRTGAFRVSLGGIVAGEAFRREPRLRACPMMDAPMSTDVVNAGLR